MSNPTRQEFESQIIAKAWKDEAFKRELLSNPKAALEKELGSPIPPDLEITVLEETPTARYLVLPAYADSAAGSELSDAELDAVAGGENPCHNLGPSKLESGSPFDWTCGWPCGPGVLR